MINSKNTRTSCKICSKFTIKTPEPRSGVFIDNFEHISHLPLVFLLLTLNMELPARISLSTKKDSPILIHSIQIFHNQLWLIDLRQVLRAFWSPKILLSQIIITLAILGILPVLVFGLSKQLCPSCGKLKFRHFFKIVRTNYLHMFYKLGVLKHLGNFIGKHLCWSLF